MSQPAAQYMVLQTDATTWELCVATYGAWKLIGNFDSESAAIAAMNALITRQKWIAAPPKFLDETGTLMAVT